VFQQGYNLQNMGTSDIPLKPTPIAYKKRKKAICKQHAMVKIIQFINSVPKVSSTMPFNKGDEIGLHM